MRESPIPDPLLVMELDAGEAEVISLARQLSPCMAVIDERRGRRIAQQVYGLPVKGTAGILVEAHRRGLISGVRSRLLELRAAGYFIADSCHHRSEPSGGGIVSTKGAGSAICIMAGSCRAHRSAPAHTPLCPASVNGRNREHIRLAVLGHFETAKSLAWASPARP